MINSLKTSNGISHLARQTTDTAPITVDTTYVPTAMSNLMRTDKVFVNNSFIDVKTESLVFRTDFTLSNETQNTYMN